MGERMNKQIKIIQVDNGYIVAFLDYSGRQKIFSSFTEMMDYLFDYFNEKANP
jgi:phage pi2 protein 07